MKRFNEFLLLTTAIFLLICFSEKLAAQSAVNDITMETDGFLDNLPKLETLIDSALAHAPILKMQLLDIKLKELQINNARKNWAKNIVSGSANFNYGDNLVINEASGLGQLNTNTPAAPHYSVGLSLKIPIATIFDHQELKRATIEMGKTEFERIISQNTLREEVNNRYSNMVNAYQKFKSLSSDIDSYDIINQNAEKEFLNSRISVQEITNFKMAYSKAKLELSNAHNIFIQSKWLLEELIGFQLKIQIQ